MSLGNLLAATLLSLFLVGCSPSAGHHLITSEVIGDWKLNRPKTIPEVEEYIGYINSLGENIDVDSFIESFLERNSGHVFSLSDSGEYKIGFFYGLEEGRFEVVHVEGRVIIIRLFPYFELENPYPESIADFASETIGRDVCVPGFVGVEKIQDGEFAVIQFWVNDPKSDIPMRRYYLGSEVFRLQDDPPNVFRTRSLARFSIDRGEGQGVPDE